MAVAHKRAEHCNNQAYTEEQSCDCRDMQIGFRGSILLKDVLYKSGFHFIFSFFDLFAIKILRIFT
jgi:hypothetical protein